MNKICLKDQRKKVEEFMKRLKYLIILVISAICLIVVTACEKKVSFTITINPNFGDVDGAKVTLTNNDGKKSLIYNQTTQGTAVDFKKVVPGSYTLTVEHNDFFPFTQSDITVNDTAAGHSVYLFMKGPGGGYVFYDKSFVSDGWRYLEAAPASSEFVAEWGAYRGSYIEDDSFVGIDVLGTQTGIGFGKANTQIINAKLSELGETGRASQLCSALNIGGKTDWFLPSKDELDLMYVNLHKASKGDFGKGTKSEGRMNWFYWSSSQPGNDIAIAWSQFLNDGDPFFDAGDQYTNDKATQLRVRAVRAF